LQISEAVQQPADLDLGRATAGLIDQPELQQPAKAALIAGNLHQLAHGLVVEHRANLPAQSHSPEIGGH
jgi:hypothetical protein